MKKNRKWQFALIVSVLVLTVYNILPTIFFYTKPLNKPVDRTLAFDTAHKIANRVNFLEDQSISWLHSFSRLLHIKPKKIKEHASSPDLIEVQFSSPQEVALFKKTFPKAGSLIPFFPATLELAKETAFYENDEEASANTLLIQRKIPIKIDPTEIERYFQYATIYDQDGGITHNYWSLLLDRLLQISLAVTGTPENAALVGLSLEPHSSRSSDFLFLLAQNVLTYDKLFAKHPEMATRFYQTLTQGASDKAKVVDRLVAALEELKDSVQKEKLSLKENSPENPAIASLEEKEEKLLRVLTIVKRERGNLILSPDAWTTADFYEQIDKNFSPHNKETQVLKIGDANPFIDSIEFNPSDFSIALSLKEEVIRLKEAWGETPAFKEQASTFEQLLYNEIARLSRESDETLLPAPHNHFAVKLKNLPDSTAFLSFDLSTVAKSQMEKVEKLLHSAWNPISEDLAKESFPITSWEKFSTLPLSERTLQLVLYCPILANERPLPGFKPGSIYVIAKDLHRIVQKGMDNPASEEREKLEKDLKSLSSILQSVGFIGYPGATYPLPSQYAHDYIFEASDFYLPLLQATREDFHVYGSRKWAILELSDVKNRILTLNRIETAMHEDLLKWRDEYNAAQVNPSLHVKLEVPKPTENPLWDNFKLSCKKYFRGDERKILQWGLDLSGGRTVQIALKDNNNKTVTSDIDIRQGINELYNRVNKMGVSDVTIRQEGSNITLDFPSSQGISASELIKSSSMTFHIVNEKFAQDNAAPLASTVNQFLQEVWNEAVVTNKKDIESINQIAWSHLIGDSLDPTIAEPRTEAAKALYKEGLRLENPLNPDVTNAFNDQISKIALYRGDSFASWNGHSHPLLIVFKNYALEGSNLQNVHASYDPSRGNYLSFEIKNSQVVNGEKISPRTILHTWTSLFAKETLLGTPNEAYTKGRGWRMAVILNGFVVSAPSLESPLRESGMITGHFTEREIQHLVADLKAGSLTFTPYILSEESVSPDLGIQERQQGILATIIALLSVIVVMVSYYRFGGLIASIAVVCNLLIMWATLQNIGATITLAGLAGVILTVGMAVDANVLVFERIREEYAKSGKLAPSVYSGYKKAFSAIFDSNITTIIAAIILLQFDSGPIKGFAVTLIIGIISSMFTALFMTRAFFLQWVQKPHRKMFTMSNLIRGGNFNFLKWSKPFALLSLVVILIGSFSFVKQRHLIFGMDFTGGFAATVELTPSQEGHYKERVAKALLAAGVSSQDFEIRELFPANTLRIFFSKNMTEAGKPFYNLPIAVEGDATYAYTSNPKLVFLVNALEKGGIPLSPESLSHLDQNWKTMSGQMSDTMRTNAIIGLLLALFCILLYITARFEIKYAISATISLVFDLLVTLALLALLHAAGLPLQMDLNTVAALMLIIGYALNDTIIVFDRIREEVKLRRRDSFKEIINASLNTTLSRTLLTSGTTLIVLLSLVILGGNRIFGFSLIMAIGVIVGTLSTFFIATLALALLYKEEGRKEKEVVRNGA